MTKRDHRNCFRKSEHEKSYEGGGGVRLRCFYGDSRGGKRIELRNFGVFKVKRTPARVGRNPVTGISGCPCT